MESKLVVIRSFPALLHAELAKSALEAYEIDAVIQHGRTQSATRATGDGTTIDLMIREEDVAAALEILGPPDERFSE